MSPLVIVLVIVGLLAVVMLVLALRSGRGTESEISERLDSYVGDQVPQMTDQDIEKEAKRLAKLTEGINKVIEKRTFGTRIATQLAQASNPGIRMPMLACSVATTPDAGTRGATHFPCPAPPTPGCHPGGVPPPAA